MSLVWAAQLDRSPSPPRWCSGTVVSGTDPGGYCEVIIDSALTVVASEAEADTDPIDPLDPNPSVEAKCLTGAVAVDERVMTVSTADGAVYVVGSQGGQPRVVGAAFIAGGVSDIAVASTSATELSALRCEAYLPHPNHLIRVEVSVHLQSGAASNTLIGRVRREDPDAVNVEVGRFLRSSAMGNNETIHAYGAAYDVAPDPGEYEFFPTLQASDTGFTVVTDPSTTPAVAAALVVTDLGALPPDPVGP